MDQNLTFTYNYSAQDNKEIEEIRRKYIPQSESKYEELKRLDNQVQSAGVMEALIAGIGGLLIFGLGMCLCMQVLASGTWAIVFGVIICIPGCIGMIAAYPLYRRLYEKEKEENTPRILQLTEELAGER